MSEKSLKDWHKTFFRRAVFFPGEPSAVAAAPREAAFVYRALGLKKGKNILDLCCGTGRHSLPLAKRGLRVVGLDATEDYLREARFRGRGVERLSFIRGDMRSLPFQGEFDAVINLWTSFGYFVNPADDLRVLKSVAKALKPGGGFLIDIVNSGWLTKNFTPKNWSRRPDGTYLLEDVQLVKGKDHAHINTFTVIGRGRRPASGTFFVRNYDYARLAKLLKQAGLVPVRRWGGLDASPYEPDCRRMVILARKK